MLFSEDPLKHPAVECCSPSEAAPGESTPYLLYTLLDQDRMRSRKVYGLRMFPYDAVQSSEWPSVCPIGNAILK